MIFLIATDCEVSSSLAELSRVSSRKECYMVRLPNKAEGAHTDRLQIDITRGDFKGGTKDLSSNN